MGRSVLDGETVFGDGSGRTFVVRAAVGMTSGDVYFVVACCRAGITQADALNLTCALFAEHSGRAPRSQRVVGTNYLSDGVCLRHVVAH
jgi:hypothetical protein